MFFLLMTMRVSSTIARPDRNDFLEFRGLRSDNCEVGVVVDSDRILALVVFDDSDEAAVVVTEVREDLELLRKTHPGFDVIETYLYAHAFSP